MKVVLVRDFWFRWVGGWLVGWMPLLRRGCHKTVIHFSKSRASLRDCHFSRTFTHCLIGATPNVVVAAIIILFSLRKIGRG